MNILNRTKYFLARNGTLIGLLILIVIFYISNERFLSVNNARNILEAVAALGVIAIPLALLVISGAVDLSVGSVASLAGITAAWVMVATGSTALGIGAGLGVGLTAGVINGLLVSYFKLNSIVVTLGALSVWGGLALQLNGGRTIAGLPTEFVDLALKKVFGIPIDVFILLLMIVWGTALLNRMPFGRKLYAIGGNRRAAFLMGISLEWTQFVMFIQVGLASSLAGLMLAAKLAAATPITGQGLEISALTVVLLGGVAFTGGMGRISGVIAGLLFVGVLRNGLVVTGTSQFLQQVFLGLTLVVAVAIDDTIRKFARREWETEPREAPDPENAQR